MRGGQMRGQGAPLAFIRQYYDDPVAHDLWPFPILHNGYASAKVNGKNTRVHVLACELAHGPRPTPEHEVAHAPGCRNRHCYFAGHLRWATKVENAADKVTDDTLPQGETHGMSKLTKQQVIEIRLRYLTGEGGSQTELAREYGVSQPVVSSIVRGETWKHVWKNFSVFDEVA